MKYRIKEISKDGQLFYIPQYRKFFIWWSFQGLYGPIKAIELDYAKIIIYKAKKDAEHKTIIWEQNND